MADPRRQLVLRARVLLLAMLASLALVLVRSAMLQIGQHDELSRLARNQYLADVKLPAWRGDIRDRHGKTLAMTVEVPSVYANPGAVTDPRQTAHQLAKLLGEPVKPLYEKLASERYFVWLDRQVAPEVALAVSALKLPGIGITKEPRRFYPNREVAAHVLGFSGVDAKGLEGIERALDESLAGESQVIAAVRDGRGRSVLAGGIADAEVTHGADVQLTIDLTIQHALQDALTEAKRTHNAKAAMAVVLDVATAEILAMGAAPSFNPNQAADADATARKNRVLTDMFEPGSTVKPLVVAAALDAGAVHADATFFGEKGKWKVGNHTVRDDEDHGWLTLTGVLQKSSNVGMAKIALQLGQERLARALKGYGFGERSGLGMPGETPGMLRTNASWGQFGTATVAFGYGVAVNLVQLASAYRVLAADGSYRAPTLVRSIQFPGGRQAAMPSVVERRVLRADTSRRLTPMLVAASGIEGTGAKAQISGYRVAGKTGTARKLDPVTGGYSADQHLALYAGFVPAEAPRVVIVVAVDEPQGDYYGGLVAAPVFARIAETTMRELGVLPNVAVMPAVAGEGTQLAAVAARSETTEHQALREADPLDEQEATPGTIPSFVGLTAREAIRRYADLGLRAKLELDGSGVVVSQQPAPGRVGDKPTRVRLVLASRP